MDSCLVSLALKGHAVARHVRQGMAMRQEGVHSWSMRKLFHCDPKLANLFQKSSPRRSRVKGGPTSSYDAAGLNPTYCIVYRFDSVDSFKSACRF